MKLKVILCSLVLGFFAVMSVCAEKMPKAKLKKIREYPESIVKQIKTHDVNNLMQDDYFLKILETELKDENKTAEEKVYFFYLMLQKIYWAFCGGIDVPLPYTYAYNCLFQGMTIYNYRNQLYKLGINDSQFFDLTFKDIEKKPILAAYSFLLGSLVTDDMEKSLSICKEAYFDKKIFEKSTWYRSMFIHNMMLLAPSFMSVPYKDGSYPEYSIICQSVIDDCDCKEEEKEDLVMGYGFINDTDNFGKIITYNIFNEKRNDCDLFILTCCYLVQARLEQEDFKQYVDMMIEELEKSEEDAWKKDLVEKRVKANDYSVDYYKGLNVTTGSYYKSWDGINMAAYDDGILYYDDDYAEFQPNNKN